ncbi:hypothetical protein ABZ353_29965 [Streptomyces niveus]|uniref:DUF7224 domain-containing protein n=1 Tax=Streptomyces niveus TaxID=193462 RepID=UPI0033D14DD4
MPLLIVFVVVAVNQDLTEWTTPHYWPSVMGSSMSPLPFIATICAGLGAWEGARLTRGAVFQQPSVRGPLHITGAVLVPVISGGLLTCLAGVAVSATAAGVSWGFPDWRILTVEFLLILASTLAGYCVGRQFNPAISVPVSLIGAFVANSYPRSWETLWVRHLVGSAFVDCCTPSEIFNVRAIWSAVAFTAGIILACAVIIDRRATRAAIAAGLALLVLGTAAGVSLARPLSSSAVTARPDNQLRCTQKQDVTVCLWPEVVHPGAVRAQAASIVKSLRSAGVPVPPELTMSARPAHGATRLGNFTEANADQVRSAVISGLMPATPRCALHGPYPAQVAAAPVAAWMFLSAGATQAQTAAHTDNNTTALAQKVRTLSPARQKAWYDRNTAAMRTCTGKPQLSPEAGTA